jgi:outer membrane protein OmpA-like peptidoglycan-associated protein
MRGSHVKLGRFVGIKEALSQRRGNRTRVGGSLLLRVAATIALSGVFVTSGVPLVSSHVASANGTTPQCPTSLSGSTTDAYDSWGQMSLNFTPGSDGGSPITNYEYRNNNGTWTAFNPPTTTRPFIFNFTTFNFPPPTVSIELRAVNAIGPGVGSNDNLCNPKSSGSVTLNASFLPRAPITATATAGNGSASIAFERGSNGGSPITNYKYSIDGGVTYNALNPANATSPLTIPGLTNGVLTTIRLIAVNANGDSYRPDLYAKTVTVTPVAPVAPVAPAAPVTTVAPATTLAPTTTTTTTTTTVAPTTTTTTVAPPKPSSPTVLECKTVVSSKISTAPVLVGEKLSNGIIFDPASPILDSRDKQELDRVARVMAQRGGLVLISGFARKNGFDSAEYLRNLSLTRARNVSDYLVAKGVRVSMRYEGYGAVTKDIGTSIERKVELRWIDDSKKIEYEKKCLNK